MTPAQRRAAIKREVAVRIRTVALMRKGRVPLDEIAEKLEVSLRTVQRDVAELEKMWLAEASETISAIKARELAELDQMERYVSAKMVDKDGKVDQGLAKLRLQIKGRRAKMLGLDEPDQILFADPDEDPRFATDAIGQMNRDIADIAKKYGVELDAATLDESMEADAARAEKYADFGQTGQTGTTIEETPAAPAPAAKDKKDKSRAGEGMPAQPPAPPQFALSVTDIAELFADGVDGDDNESDEDE